MAGENKTKRLSDNTGNANHQESTQIWHHHAEAVQLHDIPDNLCLSIYVFCRYVKAVSWVWSCIFELRFRNFNTSFQKFIMNPRRSLKWISYTHLLYQLDDFRINPLSTYPLFPYSSTANIAWILYDAIWLWLLVWLLPIHLSSFSEIRRVKPRLPCCCFSVLVLWHFFDRPSADAGVRGFPMQAVSLRIMIFETFLRIIWLIMSWC